MKWARWVGLTLVLAIAILLLVQPWKSRHEITYAGAVTSLSPGKVNPDGGLNFSMKWMAKRLQQGNLADSIEMRWADNRGMFISYQPKRQELQYGILGQPAIYAAYGVTPEDIYRAAQQGGSFKTFKRKRWTK